MSNQDLSHTLPKGSLRRPPCPSRLPSLSTTNLTIMSSGVGLNDSFEATGSEGSIASSSSPTSTLVNATADSFAAVHNDCTNDERNIQDDLTSCTTCDSTSCATCDQHDAEIKRLRHEIESLNAEHAQKCGEIDKSTGELRNLASEHIKTLVSCSEEILKSLQTTLRKVQHAP